MHLMYVNNNNNNNNQHFRAASVQPTVRNRIWGAAVASGLWGGKEMSFYMCFLKDWMDGADEYSVGLKFQIVGAE